MDLGHHILTINGHGCASRRTQCDVQDGPVFREVDFFAPEHGVDPRAQAGFLRQLQEELEGFVGNAILRVVEVDPDSLGRHPLAASEIVREELPEVQVPDFPIVGIEAIPGRAGRE